MFITVEGIDGSGKSTQSENIFQFIVEKTGRENVLWTREPGGWDRGHLIRDLLLKGELKHKHSELYLFLIDRCEHVSGVIVPALKKGKTVVCERYTDSTLAYQVWGRGLPLGKVQDLFQWSNFPVPDITLWLDIDVNSAFKRINMRGSNDRIESEGIKFLHKVRVGYQKLSDMYPDRIVRIAAGGSPESVNSLIKKELENHFPSNSYSQ